jgi:acyl carrier protein
MMTLDEFFELFCEELDEVDIESINIKTDFKNIEEWDSLVALSIIAMIDEEFEILLTGSDMMNSTTIEDLYNLILNKLS